MSIKNWVQLTTTDFSNKVCSLKYYIDDTTIGNREISENIKNIKNNPLLTYTTESGTSGILDIRTNMLYDIPITIQNNSVTSQLNPNGTLMLTGDLEGCTEVFEIKNITKKLNPPRVIDLYEQTNIVTSPKSDSKILAVEWFNNNYYASANMENIMIYKYIEKHEENYGLVNEKVELVAITSIGTPTNCIKWHPNTSQLVAGGDDKIVRIIDINLDLKKITRIIKMNGHTDSILSVDWVKKDNYDNGLIVSSSKDGTIRIWNPSKTDKIILMDTISVGDCDIKSVSWSPYGNHILSANNYRDNTCNLQIWDLISPESVCIINVCDDNSGIINMAIWNSNGHHIACSVTGIYSIFDINYTRDFVNIYYNPKISKNHKILQS
jgi:WD40 repeat protein